MLLDANLHLTPQGQGSVSVQSSFKGIALYVYCLKRRLGKLKWPFLLIIIAFLPKARQFRLSCYTWPQVFWHKMVYVHLPYNIQNKEHKPKRYQPTWTQHVPRNKNKHSLSLVPFLTPCSMNMHIITNVVVVQRVAPEFKAFGSNLFVQRNK